MKTKSILWGIVAALCIGAVLYSSFMLYTVYDEYKSASDEYDKLSQIAHSNNDTDGDTPSLNESPTERANAGEESEYARPINFADLQAIILWAGLSLTAQILIILSCKERITASILILHT